MLTLLNLVIASVVVGVSSNSVTINSKSGYDVPQCLGKNSSFPCYTISYVVSNAVSLNNSEIVLLGNQSINETLTVSHVEDLTIRGGEETASTIKCIPPSLPNHLGSGLVIKLARRVKVFNIKVEYCGTAQTVRNVEYLSAVSIINGTDIQFHDTLFYKSIGRGLSLQDVNGQVEIINSSFIENILPNEFSEHIDGAGLYIQLKECSLNQYTSCDRGSVIHTMNSRYLIQNCVFKSNKATNSQVPQQTDTCVIDDFERTDENTGQGGGIHISIFNSHFNNSFIVQNTKFHNNSADWGGAIYAAFHNKTNNNTLNINMCVFKNNTAPAGGGGALQVYYDAAGPANNVVSIDDAHFIINSARWGGAVSLITNWVSHDLSVSLNSSTFVKNAALVGAAVYLKPIASHSIFHFALQSVHFCNCSFTANNLLPVTHSQQFLDSGVIDVEFFQVDFVRHVSFIDNEASAIYSNSAIINVSQGTITKFINNTARNGGAMCLHGHSTFELRHDSHVVFHSNHARELGGAVYATLPHRTDIDLFPRCFISYSDTIEDNPDEWNSTIVFTNNSGEYGHFLFTDSVIPCQNQIVRLFSNLTSLVQLQNIVRNNLNNVIATGPATINFTLPPVISPGEVLYIQPMSFDDLNQPIPTTYKVTINSDRGDVKTTPFIISEGGQLQIFGIPGKWFNLTLTTRNTRHVSATESGILGNCPLGFVLVNSSTCVCSADVRGRELVSIPFCNYVNFRALVLTGYWIGCSANGTIETGPCSPSMCNYGDPFIAAIPRTCEYLKETSMCVKHRKGRLCGECEDGYSVFFHSGRFTCGECPYGALGLLTYFAAEVIPMVLLFIVVITFNVRITTGYMQSFFFFTHIIFLLNHSPVLTQLSETSNVLIRIHSFIVGFFSMVFFYLDEMSFCIFKGAGTLDIVSFHYVTTLFAILFLTFFIIVVNHKPFSKAFTKVFCCVKFPKIKFFKNSTIHGISTFFLLSYTLFTFISFSLLSNLPFYEQGKTRYKYVSAVQGTVDYFGPDHLPYAIPALLVLIFLSLPPPLLLISYPLLWKIKAKLRRNVESENDTTIWPIRKLLPLIDSFQGVFRDNCRMFAGLLFLWKLVMSAIMAFSNSANMFYLLLVSALLSIFTIHALVRPYTKRIDNVIDGLMLANMVMITLLKWYISIPSPGDINNNTVGLLIVIMLLLMYIPILLFLTFVVFFLLRRFITIPVELKCLSGTEEDFSLREETMKNKCSKHQEIFADEDLFSRAAELNNVPSNNVECTETGVELEVTNN